MGYEIDFLPVGDAKSGDAIALRIGDLTGGDGSDVFVAIIDGGFASSGSSVVEHVVNVYGTSRVDLVISSHLDDDHIAGLTTILRELDIGELWMHEPPSAQQEALVAAAEQEVSGVARDRLYAITASIQQSQSLYDLARDRGIPVVAPVEGMTAGGGAVTVLGPSEDYYRSLLKRFRGYKQSQSVASMVASAVEQKTGKPITETLEDEKLEEGAATGPENNSSVILKVEVDSHATILTADAGEEALGRAADYLDGIGFDWGRLGAIQVPHHGSKNNVTPSILTRILGPKGTVEPTRMAYVSCAPSGEPHHPSKRVTNAFHRRGCRVFKTAGKKVRHSFGAPGREGYSEATEVPFYREVD